MAPKANNVEDDALSFVSAAATKKIIRITPPAMNINQTFNGAVLSLRGVANLCPQHPASRLKQQQQNGRNPQHHFETPTSLFAGGYSNKNYG
jgi:hypothetical protein